VEARYSFGTSQTTPLCGEALLSIVDPRWLPKPFFHGQTARQMPIEIRNPDKTQERRQDREGDQIGASVGGPKTANSG